MQKLTERQRKFVLCYAGNATKAAIKSGFSKKTARQIGQKLLSKVDIKKAIEARNKITDGPLIASRQDRQKFWTEVMLSQYGVEMSDKLKASDLLGKSEGDFTEKIQHSGGVSVAMGRIKKGGKVLVFKVGTPRSS